METDGPYVYSEIFKYDDKMFSIQNPLGGGKINISSSTNHATPKKENTMFSATHTRVKGGYIGLVERTNAVGNEDPIVWAE